jgi:hypothetical protein
MMHSETETIEVSHFSSAEEAGEALETKVKELVEQALAAAPVAEARAQREVCERRRDQLRQSRRDLVERAKALAEENTRAAGRLDDALIEGQRLTATQLDNHVRLESEHRAIIRANGRLVERLLPCTEIELLELLAAEVFTHARELRRVAAERIEKTARLLAQAAEYEGEIAFDPRNTISGLLTAEAEQLERRGRDHLKWASERREKFDALTAQL